MSAHGGAPRHREWKLDCKVYVGNLAEGASKADVEDAFSKYGPLRSVWVARNPPGFAFVEFEDNRDAEDACRQLDGTRIAGGRIKAEMSHGRTRRGRGGPPGFRPPPYPMGGGNYGRPAPYGAPPPRGHYNGGDYPYPPYGGSRGGHHGGYHSERPPRSPPRYPPRPPRSPIGNKESFRHFSRSRSNSLNKSPPPAAARTARPRTPPSRSVSPERH